MIDLEALVERVNKRKKELHDMIISNGHDINSINEIKIKVTFDNPEIEKVFLRSMTLNGIESLINNALEDEDYEDIDLLIEILKEKQNNNAS